MFSQGLLSCRLWAGLCMDGNPGRMPGRKQEQQPGVRLDQAGGLCLWSVKDQNMCLTQGGLSNVLLWVWGTIVRIPLKNSTRGMGGEWASQSWSNLMEYSPQQPNLVLDQSD